jgi:hypothetical protein
MITQARLKKLLDYDPETGVFVWKVRPNGRVPAGSVAGNYRVDGYNQIGIDGSLYLTHRLVWLYMTGTVPLKEVDHINCKRYDNRFENLREASRGENQRNGLLYANNTSGYKGVSWHKRSGKWYAQIRVDGDAVYLGSFDILGDAAAAYAEASARLHMDFGRLT